MQSALILAPVPGVVEFARAICDFSVAFLHPSESFGLWAYFSPYFFGGTNFVHPCMVFNFEGFSLHKGALFKRWCHIVTSGLCRLGNCFSCTPATSKNHLKMLVSNG